MHEPILQAMRQSIIDGAPETALALAQTALTNGLDLLDAINHGFVPGMHQVGEQFAQHTMYLPDMMASAEAMRAAMQVLEPELKRQGAERPVAGTVVLGTTQGDIHEIGKTLVGTLISMPLAGATGPVTLAGSVVQHAAESISGLTIHQLAEPGAPIVWGGAPAIFDMSSGGAPMGAIETAMLDLACSQVGKYLGLPTHAYLVAGDGRVVDAQVEMESGMSAVLGALAGINMISGAGMLDFLACHSIEKLVIDAEAIASAQRLIEGIQPRGISLAVDMFAQAGLQGDFLKLKETRTLFRKEQHFPSGVIDRGLPSMDDSPGIVQRARRRVDELVASYQRH